MAVNGVPIITVSMTRGTNRLFLSWSVDWNGGTTPRTVYVSVAPTNSPNATVYTSTELSGSNVQVTSSANLQGGTSYTVTVTAEGFSPLFGELVQSTKTAAAFTSAVTVWNGSTFVPVTATKVWNGYNFVKATAVKSNSVAGSSPTFGTIG
jgi:hypothetical protein